MAPAGPSYARIETVPQPVRPRFGHIECASLCHVGLPRPRRRVQPQAEQPDDHSREHQKDGGIPVTQLELHYDASLSGASGSAPPLENSSGNSSPASTSRFNSAGGMRKCLKRPVTTRSGPIGSNSNLVIVAKRKVSLRRDATAAISTTRRDPSMLRSSWTITSIALLT